MTFVKAAARAFDLLTMAKGKAPIVEVNRVANTTRYLSTLSIMTTLPTITATTLRAGS